MTFFLGMVFVFMVFWRPQEWLLPFLYNWPLLDVVVGVMTLSFIIELNEGKLRMPKSHVPRVLLWLFIATVMSHVAHTYLAGVINAIELTWKFIYVTFLIYVTLDRPGRLRVFASLFVVMTCFMAVHALLQIKRGYGFARLPPLYIGPIGDKPEHFRTLFFGIFSDPNDLAQIMATSLPLAFLLPRKLGIFRLAGVACILYLLGSALTTTHSRGGLMAVVGSVTGICLMALKPRRALIAFGILAVVALALCPFSGPFLDESGHDRVVFWGEANRYYKSSFVNIIFGVGFGMISEYISKSPATHNAFVSAYTELGVFGYWFWFTLLIGGFLGCTRTRAALKKVKTPDAMYMHRFAGLALAAMTGYAVSSYFLSRAYVYPSFFLFAMLNAVPIVAQKLLPDDHPPLVIPKRDVFLYGGLGSVFSIFYIYYSIILLNKAWYG